MASIESAAAPSSNSTFLALDALVVFLAAGLSAEAETSSASSFAALGGRPLRFFTGASDASKLASASLSFLVAKVLTGIEKRLYLWAAPVRTAA